jgi:hypothetical protein
MAWGGEFIFQTGTLQNKKCDISQVLLVFQAFFMQNPLPYIDVPPQLTGVFYLIHNYDGRVAVRVGIRGS